MAARRRGAPLLVTVLEWKQMLSASLLRALGHSDGGVDPWRLLLDDWEAEKRLRGDQRRILHRLVLAGQVRLTQRLVVQVVTVTQENFIPVCVPLVTYAAAAVVCQLLFGADAAAQSLLDGWVPRLLRADGHLSLQLQAVDLAHLAHLLKSLEFILRGE